MLLTVNALNRFTNSYALHYHTRKDLSIFEGKAEQIFNEKMTDLFYEKI